MTAHRTGSMFCPLCGATLSGALGTNTDASPSAGAVVLCGYCRALLMFEGDPVDQLRRPTLDEETELLADPDVQRAIAVLAELHRRHNVGAPPEERGTTR